MHTRHTVRNLPGRKRIRTLGTLRYDWRCKRVVTTTLTTVQSITNSLRRPFCTVLLFHTSHAGNELRNCHGVIETKRGHDLGRLILEGSAIPNTGVPGDVGGYTKERIIRAPADGPFEPVAAIGQKVELGEVVAKVNGIPVAAQLTGIVRGMLPAGIPVTAGMKAGDIDPRCEVRHCFTVSDKARAIGGGVLEGILYFGRRLGLWND